MSNGAPETETLRAEKLKAEAERDLAKKQLEQLQAELSLAKAGATDRTKAAAEAQTAIFNAQKAQADAATAAANAEATAQKAKFGSIAGTDLGTTTADAGAGSFEASLLAASAIDRAASVIKTALDNVGKSNQNGIANGNPRYIIFTGLQRPNFSDNRLFEAQINCVVSAYRCAAEAHAKADLAAGKQAEGAVKLELETGVAGAVTAIGAAAEILRNLGSYFRADYRFSTATVSGVDADLLAVSLAGMLKDCWYPARWAPAADETKVYQRLNPWSDRRGDAPFRHAELLKREKEFADGASAAPDPAENARLSAVADLYRAATEFYSAADKGFDDFLASLAEVDTTGVLRATRIAEQRAIADALSQGALAVLLHVGGTSGTTYTKKSLWTFLGGAPFYVSGGAIVSYLVVDNHGQVKAAGQQRGHSGFVKVHEVPDEMRDG